MWKETENQFLQQLYVSNPTHNYRPMNREEYLDNVRDFYYTEAFLGPDYTTPNPDFDLASKLPDAPLRDENGNISPYNYTGGTKEHKAGICLKTVLIYPVAVNPSIICFRTPIRINVDLL